MAVVDTTRTFINNEQVTSTKLNEIMDNSLFVSGAVASGGGLEVTTGGQMQIKDNGVKSEKIPSNAITTAKIADGNVTPEKLSSGAPSWVSNEVSTSRGLAVGGQITASLGSTFNSYVDFHTIYPLTSREARIRRASGIDGIFEIENTGTGSIKMNASGGVTFGSANMPTPSGTAPVYGARAFAKLNPYVLSDRTTAYKSGNYSTSGSTVTITITGHGLKVDDKIRLDFTSGGAADGLYSVITATDANTFTVSGAGGTAGSVTAQFVKIQSAKNISSASFYDSGDNHVVLNFESPMPSDDYCTQINADQYSYNCYEYSNGTTQLNTVNQAYIGNIGSGRFVNVTIFA